MHRAINIKHRIVRRVDIEIAPLATFDTIDLGDEDFESVTQPLSNDNELIVNQESRHYDSNANSCDLVNSHSPLSCNVCATGCEPPGDGGLNQTRTIGGNTSKKSLSQAGGERGQRDAEGSPGAQDVDSVAEVSPAQ
ncbi:hypothetical protein EGW08_016137, partial [Elysia chlorotica]